MGKVTKESYLVSMHLFGAYFQWIPALTQLWGLCVVVILGHVLSGALTPRRVSQGKLFDGKLWIDQEEAAAPHLKKVKVEPLGPDLRGELTCEYLVDRPVALPPTRMALGSGSTNQATGKWYGTISHCCVLMQLRIPSNSQLVPWDWYWETSTRMEKPGKGWLIGTGCLFRTRVVFFYWTSLPATTGSEPWPCLNIKSFRSVLSFVVESSDFQFSDPQRRRNSSSR